MADNPGMAAIAAMMAKKRNAGGAVAGALPKAGPSKPGGGNDGGRSGAIARRLAKAKSAGSQPPMPGPSESDY